MKILWPVVFKKNKNIKLKRDKIVKFRRYECRLLYQILQGKKLKGVHIGYCTIATFPVPRLLAKHRAQGFFNKFLLSLGIIVTFNFNNI